MIASITLSLLASAAAPAPVRTIAPHRLQDATDEFQTRFEAAGSDTEALWKLQEWAKEQGKIIQARECLKKIVELDPDHEAARKALGHHSYDGQWFKSYYELSEYKRAEDERMKAKGLVRYNDEWVAIEDEPYLRMGMVKEEESGKWVTKRELERRAQEAKYVAEGWQKQFDNTWVPPDEQANWSKEPRQWKCGDQWLEASAADEYHSQLYRWWTLPTEEDLFEVWTTCPLNHAWAGPRSWVNETYADLKRAYGLTPEKPPVVIVLNGLDQYRKFSGGDQALGIPGTEVQGQSAVHYAYFAEALFLPYNPPEYGGTGVCMWNLSSEQKGRGGMPDPFGYFAVRHAAALSYAEAIDPSLTTVSRQLASLGQQQFPFIAFWQEKRIPFWFRIGVAAYCERYFYDAQPPEGYSNWHTRDWSLDNIRRSGGAKPFQEIFNMQLDGNKPEESGQLINQAGMLVSFILDGKCPPVQQAHAALKAALRSGEDTKPAAEALQKALVEHQGDFSLYVKM